MKMILPFAVFALGFLQTETETKTATKSQDAKNQALLQLVDSLAKKTEELRGLKFKLPVKRSVKTKEELRQYLLKEMKEEMSSEKFQQLSQIYELFGLLPENYDFEKGMLDLLTDSVAGLYDPKTKEFFVVSGFPESLQKITIVHELTHALDDQYFDLQKMIDKVKDEEDQTLAVRAVVEGSGTLIMTRYQFQSIELMAELMKDMKEAEQLMKEQVDVLSRTPIYLVRSLSAAYLVGQQFLTRGQVAMVPGKTEAEDFERAFKHPPLSSEQVIHPEKYWNDAKKDEPVTIVMPDLLPSLGEGWKMVAQDTLGELAIATLTEDPDLRPDGSELGALVNPDWTNPAAQGWGGDRYAAYQKGEQWIVCWMTVWDESKDAEEFVKAYKPKLEGKVFIQDKNRVVVVLAKKKDPLLEKLASVLLEKSVLKTK